MSTRQNRRERHSQSASVIPAPAASAFPPARRPAPLPVHSVPRSEGSSLDPATRSFLEPRFGHSLGNVRVYSDAQADHLSKDFDAAAFTVGQDIFFARGNYDPESAAGQRLIAHEVAHAVQQRGTRWEGRDLGSLDVAGRHSRSETEAHAATDAALRGDAVRLSASSGPVVSRWESGEHKKAMDEAIKNLPEERRKNVDPNVSNLMSAENKIRLANGVFVTPGHITAMMGDFYGKFDKKTGALDPAASFEQLNNADPKEMQALMKLIDREAETGKPADASEWEWITRRRREGKDSNSPQGPDSYLELAKKNDSHFSAPNAEGTQNNMGAYSAFHQMALQAAQEGDMNRARALEASGGHYLTDRFSAGHNFEKEGVLKASGWDPTGDLANMAVKTAHDDMNTHGIGVKDGKTGDGWTAYGDGKWDTDQNKANREHTAQAVVDSWSELEKVGSGKSSAAQVQEGGFSALKNVPQWDPKNQERAEAVARNTSLGDILWNYGDKAGDTALATMYRAEGHVENAVSDAWDWTKDKAGAAWDWTKNTAGNVWDWTKDKAGGIWNWLGGAVNNVGETVSGAWDWTKNMASGAANWVGDTAGDAWDWTKNVAGEGANWVGDKAGQAWNAAGDAASWADDRASDTWDWTKNTASDAADWVGDKAGGAWNAAGDTASWAGDKASQAYNWAGDTASDTWDWTKNTASDTYDWAGDKAGQAWNAAEDAGSWVGGKAQSAWNWATSW